MKFEKVILLLIAIFIAYGVNDELSAKRKILLPEKCRTAKYSCILKKLDGESFLCVRTAKQRQQNARIKVRIVRSIRCLDRYPVEYEELPMESVNAR
ncbi:MAG: hypothetical protein GY786_21895 [Proteobacteria bacterium]|nr:hypothetical protein [Pseudomonadota bacterium]